MVKKKVCQFFPNITRIGKWKLKTTKNSPKTREDFFLKFIFQEAHISLFYFGRNETKLLK